MKLFTVSEVAKQIGCRSIDVTTAFRNPPPQFEFLRTACPLVGGKSRRRIIPQKQVANVVEMVRTRGYVEESGE